MFLTTSDRVLAPLTLSDSNPGSSFSDSSSVYGYEEKWRGVRDVKVGFNLKATTLGSRCLDRREDSLKLRIIFNY